MQIQSIICNDRHFVCSLGVTFYRRGMEGSNQRYSSLRTVKNMFCKKINLNTVSITKLPAATAKLLFKFCLRHSSIMYYIYYPSVFQDRILYVGDKWQMTHDTGEMKCDIFYVGIF